MKWFYNLKIAVKLMVSFIIVAVIAGAVGFFGITNITKIDQMDTEMYELNAAPLGDIGDARVYYQRIRINLRDMILDKEMDKKNKYLNTIRDLDKKIQDSLVKFDKTIRTEEGRKQFDLTQTAIEQYAPVKEVIITHALAGQEDQALVELREGFTLAQAVEDGLGKLAELKIELAKNKSDSNHATASSTLIIMIILVASGVVIAIVLGIFISSIISRPVKRLTGVADKLAIGDVNVNVESDTKDEIGLLMVSFGKMIANIREQAAAVEKIASGDLTAQISVKSQDDLLGKKLTEMIQMNNEILNNINSAAEQVASGSRQVSDSSIALSQGATEQASSIEELTASIEEISAQTKQNAENANQANGLAENARTNAEQGNQQMKEMLKAMQDINDASSNISKIIKVIDDIAFQTNILALNAAVEAARAGQHGKGFAVVAEEVRNLAARSANAAKETTDMIEGSIKKVEGGTRIANETAGALTKIVEGVAKVAGLVNDIATASNEQASGIAQINQGVMQVSQVVQTNSATSEESAAASEELSSQAELLKDQVSRFKLKKESRHTTYKGLEDLNPDVLKVLEGIGQNRSTGVHSEKHFHSEAAAGSKKIALSDNEFGKY